MAIRIKYRYTEYKDYPEATHISESRSRNVHFIISFCSYGILASLVCFFVDFTKTWPMIFLLLLCALGLLSIFSGYYDSVTERKIKKAIAARDEMMAEIRDLSYDCQAIKIIANCPSGLCAMCHSHSINLSLCDIKFSRKLNRIIPVCDACIEQLKANAGK